MCPVVNSFKNILALGFLGVVIVGSIMGWAIMVIYLDLTVYNILLYISLLGMMAIIGGTFFFVICFVDMTSDPEEPPTDHTYEA